MRAVFLGTPPTAVPPLAALLEVADIDLVITQPDKARGRSGHLMPSAVKTAAEAWGLPVSQPGDAAGLVTALERVRADIGVVVAYGRILNAEALASTRVGFVNIHFSLLPRWRGAAPVERAILAGDAATGVSLMQLDEGMDTGPVISAIETPIAEDETGGTLAARLSHLGALLLADALPGFMSGSLHPAAQISAGATYAARLHPEEAELDWRRPAADLAQRVRAFNPRPGAWLMAGGERFKVLAGEAVATAGEPGWIEAREGEAVLGTGDGGLVLVRLQPPGKRPQLGRDWMNGRRGAPLQVDE